MNTDLNANEIAASLWNSARQELDDQWDEIKHREVEELRQAVGEFGRLLAQRTSPWRKPEEKAQDDRELAHLSAQIANWTWAGADRVRKRWKEWLEDRAEDAGVLLRRLAKGLLP